MKPPDTVRMCAELLREMMALDYGKQSLVYGILHEMVRNGSGLVEEDALVGRVVRAAGVEKCTVRRHYLPAGDGTFWRRGKGRVGVVAPEKVAPAPERCTGAYSAFRGHFRWF